MNELWAWLSRIRGNLCCELVLLLFIEGLRDKLFVLETKMLDTEVELRRGSGAYATIYVYAVAKVAGY